MKFPITTKDKIRTADLSSLALGSKIDCKIDLIFTIPDMVRLHMRYGDAAASFNLPTFTKFMASKTAEYIALLIFTYTQPPRGDDCKNFVAIHHWNVLDVIEDISAELSDEIG